MSSETNSASETPFVTSDAPKTLDLTVYQGGAAVVREKRVVKLPAGSSRVYFDGLPAKFAQGSLTVVSVDGNGQFKLGPISYQPANLSVAALLAKAVGRKVEMVDAQGSTIGRGTLLFVLGNQVVLQNADGAVVVPVTSKFQLIDGVPQGVSAKASLTLEPTVSEAGEFAINTLYETEGLSWAPRFELFYNAAAGVISRLTCWVDLTNDTGVKLEKAKFKLIATSNRRNGNAKALRSAAPMAAGHALESVAFSADGADTETVGESKLYVLPDALTLNHGESKQTVLIMAENVPAVAEYYLNPGYYSEDGARDYAEAEKEPVYVRLLLKNDKASKLGYALPAGHVSVYEPDSSGALQKTDSSSVGHVAEDEGFTLNLGNPTRDIKATRVLTSFKQDPEPEVEEVQDGQSGAQMQPRAVKKPAPRFREEHRELTIHNFKDREVEVCVTEQIPHNATFLVDEKHINEPKASGEVKVKVAAKGKTTVSYAIRYQIN